MNCATFPKRIKQLCSMCNRYLQQRIFSCTISRVVICAYNKLDGEDTSRTSYFCPRPSNDVQSQRKTKSHSQNTYHSRWPHPKKGRNYILYLTAANNLYFFSSLNIFTFCSLYPLLPQFQCTPW